MRFAFCAILLCKIALLSWNPIWTNRLLHSCLCLSFKCIQTVCIGQGLCKWLLYFAIFKLTPFLPTIVLILVSIPFQPQMLFTTAVVGVVPINIRICLSPYCLFVHASYWEILHLDQGTPTLEIVSSYMPLSDLFLAKFFSRLPDVLVLWSLDCLHDSCVRRFAANSILLSHQIHFCCLTSYQWFEKLRVDWEKLRDWLHVSLHHLQFTSIVFFFSPNEPDGLEVQRKWSVFKNWENKNWKAWLILRHCWK